MLPEITQEWLQKANEDYGFASSSMEFTDYFGQICFHFQQAAEKYLKAFIISNKLNFRPVHNLLELLSICKKYDPEIKQLEHACHFLNPFYIDSRYPVHWPTAYDKKTALSSKIMVEEIRNYVLKSLTNDEHQD